MAKRSQLLVHCACKRRIVELRAGRGFAEKFVVRYTLNCVLLFRKFEHQLSGLQRLFWQAKSGLTKYLAGYGRDGSRAGVQNRRTKFSLYRKTGCFCKPHLQKFSTARSGEIPPDVYT